MIQVQPLLWATICLSVTFASTLPQKCDTLIDQTGQACPAVGQYLYPDTEHCSQYWECNEGCAHHRLCPNDYLFDAEDQLCKNPKEVFCNNRNCDDRPCEQDSTPTPTPSPVDCSEDGYIPDPNNCIKYYHCFDGAVEEHLTCQVAETGEQLLYDDEKVQCDYPSRVDCGERPICDKNDQNCNDNPATSTPSDDDVDDFNCPGDGYFADPDNCIKYYHCFNNVVEEHITCPIQNGEQLCFDDEHDWCDFPSRVNCGERPICDGNDQNCEQPSTSDPSKPTQDGSDDFDCPGDGYYADPDNCIKYYHCFDGKVEEHLTCAVQNGVQLHFDSAHSWCDFPDRVNCGNRPVCDANDENCAQASTPAPNYCSNLGTSCSTEGEFLPQGACEPCFCECGSAIWQELCCQPGLVFNPITNNCDWATNCDG